MQKNCKITFVVTSKRSFLNHCVLNRQPLHMHTLKANPEDVRYRWNMSGSGMTRHFGDNVALLVSLARSQD